MRRYLSLLLFIGLAWGQDEYPYFSDMDKQLEFEQKKISIIDVKETRQHISGGGSEFNWLSLISEYQPTYVVAPIRTDFYYVTKFSITKNSKVLSEIDFLNTIGLNEKADSLVLEYQKRIIEKKDKYDFDRARYENEQFLGGCIMIFGAFGVLSNIYVLLVDEAVSFGGGLFMMGLSSAVTGFGYWIRNTPMSLYQLPVLPEIQSYLSNTQVQSLSEAYNRKLYNDISKK